MRLSIFKVPGHTLIPNIILQHLATILSPHLQPVFNASFELGYCAKPFRDSVTISMQKPHKDDYNSIEFYRPIVLLDTIRKTLGSILTKRISATAKFHIFLLKTHFRGRRNNSTEHAIHYLVEKTSTEWEQGKELSALMLDVTVAFDNVSHFQLIHNLQK